MKDYQRICDGLLKASWGYFFLYFDINIQSVSLLPSFIGYTLPFRNRLSAGRRTGIILTVQIWWNSCCLVWHSVVG